MSVLSTIASAFTPALYPRALERFNRARSALATAQAQESDGTARSMARAKEIEAFPHLAEDPVNEWSPARDDIPRTQTVLATIELADAAACYDAHEPRIEALRNRVKALRAELDHPEKSERLVAIRRHAEALEQLGVDVGDIVTRESQRPIADELAEISADFAALRAKRSQEAMPEPYMFTDNTDALQMQLGVPSGQLLDGLRRAALYGSLNADVFDRVIALLGTRSAQHGNLRGALYEMKERRERWEARQQAKADRRGGSTAFVGAVASKARGVVDYFANEGGGGRLPDNHFPTARSTPSAPPERTAPKPAIQPEESEREESPAPRLAPMRPGQGGFGGGITARGDGGGK